MKESIEEFNLPEEISFYEEANRSKFKRMIKERATKLSFEGLLKRKENHRKMRYLNYQELKMQDYLKAKHLPIETKRLLYKWRTHTENFKTNYKNSHDDLRCDLCFTHEDSQEASISCKSVEKVEDLSANYFDIFKENIPNNIIRVTSSISKYGGKGE